MKIRRFHLFSGFFLILIFFCNPFISTVWANPVDLFGLSSKSSGKGDAVVASASGGSSLFYNPGRLGITQGFTLSGGITGQVSSLNLPTGNQSINDALYSSLGLTFTIPFRGFLENRIRAGFMLMAPANEIAWIRMHMPAEPFYPYYENRSQRLIMVPGVSFMLGESELFGKFGLGFGINYFAGLNGAIIGYEGATRSVEARVFEEMQGKTALNLGLAWEKGNFKAGISYRQAFGVGFHNVSFNHVAGTDLNIDLNATTLYSPHTISYGFAYDNNHFSLELDIVESLWSFYSSPFVSMRSQLPLVGALVGDLPEVKFKNSLGIRIGSSFKLNKQFRISGGLGFDQSIISKQTGITNILDGNKITLSSGVSWEFSKGIFLHAHLRYQMILGETSVKKIVLTDADCGSSIPINSSDSLRDEIPCVVDDETTSGFQTTNPGFPSITSGGYVLSGGLSLEVRR